MRVVVPFGAAEPKTRLAPVLDAEERREFADAMLADVLEVLSDCGYEPTVLANRPVDIGTLPGSVDDGARDGPVDDGARDGPVDDGARDGPVDDGARDGPVDDGARDGPVDADVPVIVDEQPLTAAVNARLPDDADDEPTAVVMADLALATPAALSRLFEPAADVVLAPGRGGGTNAVVACHPDFRVDYHGASIRDHRDVAAGVGASLATVDSFRLATDVDEPDDLVEVLLHSDGRAAAWLREAGFDVVERDGRVGVDRR